MGMDQAQERQLIADAIEWHPPPRWTRREALVAGAVGLATVAGRARGASWWRGLLGAPESAGAPAEIFAGDAPNEETWSLWQQRGWVKEAAHYLQLGRNVQCKVCPNNCLLTPGDRSHCRNKVNRDGTLYTLAYANPCTFHVDPVEKKPLYHYRPGTRTFSLATSGCVFRCLNCQNWEISQKTPEQTKSARGPELRLRVPLPPTLSLDEMSRLSLFPDDLPAVALALGCPSVSYTYSEPTAYFEYVRDATRAARERGVQNVVVTCGSIEERPLRELLACVDAAHVDLKGFTEESYRQLNSGRLAPVLHTLQVYRELGVWFEIINLVVPTYTDDLDGIKRMCGWIVDHLGPDRPLHFSRFFPQHKLAHLEPTPVDLLVRAREAARAAGLRYVYVGNVPDLTDAANTHCPNCHRVVIERDLYSVVRNEITAGRCRFCQTAIAGLWTT